MVSPACCAVRAADMALAEFAAAACTQPATATRPRCVAGPYSLSIPAAHRSQDLPLRRRGDQPQR